MNVDKNVMIKYLLEVLKRETSENNRKKLIELGDLVAKEMGKDNCVDARTIKGYIALLIALGFDIRHETGGYYLSKRFLDRAETKLLCDQILFSSIMPADRKNSIIESLLNDLTDSDKKLIKSEINESYKSQKKFSIYDETICNIEKILDAMSKEPVKKITFDYGDYNEKKQLQLKPDSYTVSPYHFIFEQGKYYLLCQLDEDEGTGTTRNFRIDLMRNIKVRNMNAQDCPIEEDLTEYCLRQVNMFSSDMDEEEEIVLEVNSAGLRGLYDKLGLDSVIKVTKVRDDKNNKPIYKASFKASLEGTKYFVLQYLDQIVDIKTPRLKKLIEKSLKDACEKYGFKN
ncbi:MAG: WYL domain-containing protein [Clostridia bacterium]|nr:WYL domain-containing protein [Clostridia bacterium]